MSQNVHILALLVAFIIQPNLFCSLTKLNQAFTEQNIFGFCTNSDSNEMKVNAFINFNIVNELSVMVSSPLINQKINPINPTIPYHTKTTSIL